MPRKKNNNEVKVACHDLKKILLIKKLTDRQRDAVFKKLVEFAKNASAGNFDMIPYVKIVIVNTLTDEEKVIFIKIMDSFSEEEEKSPNDPLLKAKKLQVLTAYYHAIVDYYPEFSLEVVLHEVNGDLANPLMLDKILAEDKEFEKEVEKKTSRRSSKKKKLDFTTKKDFEDLKVYLRDNIIGQDEAIDRTCDALKLKAAGFTSWVSLFFLGKTGRGKTQLAKKLAEKYCDNFWRIDCGEFQHGHEIGRLIGAPPGYIGHTTESLIKTKGDKSNKWIILFDEIEKAHPKLYNLLLALLDNGKVTDNIGNEVDFSESVFIFTSNCGMSDLKDSSMAWKHVKNEQADKEEVLKALESQFTPEFRGRIDEFIFFNDLNRSDIEKIAKKALHKYPVRVTQELLNYTLEVGYSEKYGARDLERTIRKLIGLPLADEILSKKIPIDGTGNYEAIVSDKKIQIINTVDF